MKLPDLLLLSLAAGLTLLNAVVLASDYPRDFTSASVADPLAPDAPKSRAYRGIVLHDVDRPHSAFYFHFVIGDGDSFPDGEVIPTERWRRQEGAILEIALGPAHTEKQEKALYALIERLRRDYGITRENVGTHRELEAGTKCPFEVDGVLLRKSLP